MEDTGYIAPASGGRVFGTVNWSNPERIIVADDSSASVIVRAATPPSEYLVALAFDPDIPEGQHVHGVAVRWLLRSNNVTEHVHAVALFNGTIGGSPDYIVTGEAIGEPKTEQVAIGTSSAWLEFGGPNDRWGLDLTPEIVNAADFGVGLQVHSSSTNLRTVSCDAAEMIVYYGDEPSVGHGHKKRSVMRLTIFR